MLTLLKSRQIIETAIRRAQQLGINICVAVCDSGGRLIALNQMDGSVGWEADRSSMGKAVAAALIGRSSHELSEHLRTNGPRLSSCSNVISPRGQRGGLPVLEEGVVQGGCGVSGAPTPEQDEECARAGVATYECPEQNGHLQTMLTGLRLPFPSRTQPEGFRDL